MTRGSSGGPVWLRAGHHRTRGHDDAVASIAGWGRHGVPHAILIAGPASIGKTTLARDLAAALLCTAGAAEPVPCGRCGACLRVASGNHPDLHVLRPAGPGGQVRIGGRDAAEPGVRDLIVGLALSAAEGGARVAIVESAHRMNDDAQNALLRTLEEPPPGVVIVLCADDEDRLLPTIRSRCVRIRLGPVSSRSIEGLLGELGLADPPAAARLARLAEGRPGVAIAFARRPDAVRGREELLRRLLDLAGEGPAARLTAAPSLLAAARESATAGIAADDGGGAAAVVPGPGAGRATGGRGRSKAGGTKAVAPVGGSAGSAASAADPLVADAAAIGHGRGPAPDGDDAPPGDADTEAAADGEPGAGRRRRPPAAERREAARALIDAWRVVARDLAVASVGGRRQLRDAALLEEVGDVAGRLPAGSAVAFLARLEATERLVEANASPELAIDTLLLAWPRAAASPVSAHLAPATGGDSARATPATADGQGGEV
jgi:DNA polymerase-3 subunit delta'